MVAGYHLIWTAYGWWLPNDPRGSSSHGLRVIELEPLGEIHPGRKIVQPTSAEIRRFYEKARDLLKHPLLTIANEDVAVIAASFAEVIASKRYTCYACALMPDHVHALIRKHRVWAEEMIEDLQDGSRAALIDANRRAVTHPVWGGPGWKVYLEDQADFERTVRYIELNPVKIGLPKQRWPFVKPYDGWLPGVPPWLRAQADAKP